MITEKTITELIYREAELLDTMQWQSWLDLFHPEGRYWMPLEWQQQDPVLQPSLMYEDLLLLKVRVERLAGERTFSQKPKSRCHHLLQAPRIVVRPGRGRLQGADVLYLYGDAWRSAGALFGLGLARSRRGRRYLEDQAQAS